MAKGSSCRRIMYLLEKPEKGADFQRFLERVLQGFSDFCIIKTALEIGIFEKLEGSMELEELARQHGFDERLLYLFLENLVRLGLLKKRGRSYAKSSMAEAFFSSSSPYCQLERVDHELNRRMRWLRLHELLKGDVEQFHKLPFFGHIIHTLAQQRILGELQETAKAVSELKGFKEARKLLDLGGGHGLYCIAFTSLNQDLEAYVLDLPEVLEETKKYLQRFGVNRVHLLPGDFFKDDLGKGYDIVFSSYNPAGKRKELIPKIWKCLKDGGLYINEQFFPQQKEVTPEDLEWNLWTFGMAKGVKAYTFEGDLDLEGYIEALNSFGFNVEKVLEMRPQVKMIVARKGQSEDLF